MVKLISPLKSCGLIQKEEYSTWFGSGWNRISPMSYLKSSSAAPPFEPTIRATRSPVAWGQASCGRCPHLVFTIGNHRTSFRVICRLVMALSFVSTIGRLPLTPVRFGRSTARCAARPRWFASSAAIVDKAIIDNNVMVFSASYCPYCRQVKSLFKELNVDHAVWELDERADGDDIRGILLEKTGQRTVPNVFISGKHVGGCDGKFLPKLRTSSRRKKALCVLLTSVN